MACPILDDIVFEEIVIVWWAFRPQRVLWDRSDPLAFSEEYLFERYRFSSEGIHYLCGLPGPKIQHRTPRSRAMTVSQMVCVALRFFASGSFLYSIGDADNLNKGAVCRAIRLVYLALKSVMHIFITFPGHRRLCYIKEAFYKIAGNMKYTHKEKCYR